MTGHTRQAATVCALRDGENGVEVLMCRRVSSARFMGGAWVFPGGAVDAADAAVGPELLAGVADDTMRPWVAAALRELAEEVQVWITDPPTILERPELPAGHGAVFAAAARAGRRLDGSGLVYFANWVTPAALPRRFDTRFFAVAVDAGVTPHPDPVELAGAEWLTPEDALARAASGEWHLPFPTVRTLQRLSGWRSAADAVEGLRQTDVVPIQPRLRVSDGGQVEIVVPGEDGFDDLSDEAPDAVALLAAAGSAASPETRPAVGGSDEG